ncbi:MAG: radical SAM protein [Sphaerochaeta sp.]|nr:radical SAM protein [Sphaerochaeta sp.]
MMEQTHLLDAYRQCELCPNYCRVDRSNKKTGRCGETDEVRVAWSGLHRGEEPPVTGKNGSGMIFFCGCPLHCAYCQNHQISGGIYGGDPSIGVVVTVEELATLMLSLQDFGAANINLVTGTHFIPSIVAAIEQARIRGLELQIVWNTSGFESKEGLKLIDPYVDLYLIDVKTLDEKVAKTFCGLPAYSASILPVMEFLKKRHPKVVELEDGSLQGLLVRHLLFPGTIDATKEFLKYFAKELKDSAYLSLMVQFVPPLNDVVFPEITEDDYDELIALMDTLEIEDGFVQELSENISWIPDFSQDIPFPKGFADVLPFFLELKHR